MFKKRAINKDIFKGLTGENALAALILLDIESRGRVMKIFADVKETDSFEFTKLSPEDQSAMLEFVKQICRTV